MLPKKMAFLPLCFLLTATTYVLHDNGKEVGRLVENDGKSATVMVNPSKKDPIPSPEKSGAVSRGSAIYPWYENDRGYKTALWEQKRTGAPVLLYFYAPWCPYCKSFDRQILGNAKVKKSISGILRVKIEAEKEMAISEKYGITSFPKVLVLSSSGTETKKIKTHTDPEAFIESLKKAGFSIA